MMTSSITEKNNPRSGREEYDPRHFVGRKEELGLVAMVAETIQNQSTPSNPVVSFWGVAGIGKTWLLKHLERTYRYQSRESLSFAIYHTFENETGDPLPSLIRAITDAIKQQITPLLTQEQERQLNAAAAQLNAATLVTLIRAVATQLIPVLLLDNTETLTADAWADVERKVIEPLAQHGRIIIVVAGRRSRQWARFEARRRAKSLRVEVLSQDGVQELLQRYHVDIDAALIYPYTAGTPDLVRDIVEFATGVEAGAVLDNQWVEKLRPHLLTMLNKFEERFVSNIDNKLRPFLLATIPLRTYRLDAFSKMTAEVERAPALGSDVTLLRTLATTEAVWWDSPRRAYMTDPVGRRILDRKLLLQDQTAYREKHRRAIEIYQASAEEFPFNSDEFILEAWFHLASLYASEQDETALLDGYSAPDGITHLRGVEEWLDFAERYLRPDRLMILHQQFSAENDVELYDLMPPHTRKEIMERLNRLTSP